MITKNQPNLPMADLQSIIADNRQAVSAFLATARAVPAPQWTEPRAPGKWSPGQVTEHVARAYEISLAVLQRTFPGPAAPSLLRPVIRTLFLRPVLRNGRFGKGGKAPKPFRPGSTHTAPDALTARLQSAADGFEATVTAAARSGQTTVDHPFFGRVSLTDYLRLQVIDTEHHRQQLPGAAPTV